MYSQLKQYHQRRTAYISQLGGKCVECGTAKDLQFDHIDPAKKKYKISAHLSGSRMITDAEIQACQLLCASCHKKKHEAKHGTISRYRHQRCRCELCRSVWNEYCREIKRRRKAA